MNDFKVGRGTESTLKKKKFFFENKIIIIISNQLKAITNRPELIEMDFLNQ